MTITYDYSNVEDFSDSKMSNYLIHTVMTMVIKRMKGMIKVSGTDVIPALSNSCRDFLKKENITIDSKYDSSTKGDLLVFVKLGNYSN